LGKILTSGIDLLVVYQESPAKSSTIYATVEGCKGPIGLSPPTVYLYQSVGYKVNEG
jgi:hypothetical protein